MSHTTAHAEKPRSRTPLFRAIRRMADAIEEVVDDVIERGEGAERDTRTLVRNLVRERELEDKKHEDAKK